MVKDSRAPTRPVLRYHGGKWKLAPWIISHFPPHRVYVEPFGGAASVLLRKPPAYAEIYNDLDSEVVNVFRVLRDHRRAQRLKKALMLTPFAREEFDESYEPHPDPVEQARRTIIRSFMGFGSPGVMGHNTGFRAQSSRSGTTPAHDWRNFPSQIEAFCARLSGVVLERRTAAKLIAAHDSPQTLFYIDPPYVWETRGTKNPYDRKHRYRFEMDSEAHRRLAEQLHGLAGMIVLSGYRCDLYDEIYAEWSREECDAHADGARDRVECLWLNPAASAARSQRPLLEVHIA